MSRNRSFYKREDSFTSGDLDVGFRYASDEEPTEDDDDDSDFLQDIPYTSSSLDRSSIGSIPWADDAIKKNQLDWERVERMLHGQEELTQEVELRNEILEWQRKFPHLVGAENEHKKQSSDSSMHNNLIDSLDLDSISNLSLNSITDDDDHELYDNDLETPTNKDQKLSTNGMLPKVLAKPIEKRQTDGQEAIVKLGQLHNRGLTISSVPMKLRQRYATSRNIYGQVHQETTSVKATTLSPPPPTPPHRRLHDKHSPLDVPLSASIANQNERRHSHMRMPPILNVLESKRRFRGLTGNNRSFVQLAHIQQAKSAAVTASHQRSEDPQTAVCQLPLAAATIGSRFLNNRNTIILPSIHLEHAQESNSMDEVTDVRYISSVPLGSYGMGGSGRRYLNLSPQKRACNRGSSSTTPATNSSTGRSISAAVHPHSRYEFSAFYLPYSASKFKVLK